MCKFFENIFEVVQLHFHLNIKQFRFQLFFKGPKKATMTTKIEIYICSHGAQCSILSISGLHTWWLFRPKSDFEVGNFKKIFLGSVNPQISKKKFFSTSEIRCQMGVLDLKNWSENTFWDTLGAPNSLPVCSYLKKIFFQNFLLKKVV